MIQIASFSPDWHDDFLRMLPVIVRYAKFAFRNLRSEAKAEAVQEVVANCLRAYVRLVDLDKADIAYPTVLARYGVRQTRDERKVGGRLNCKDISSRYCQRLKGLVQERLDKYDTEDECWEEVLIPDNTCTPAELAASRIDFPAWLNTLNSRDRKVARFLALGNRTQDAARRFDVSQGRVSQLRRELVESWREFTGEGDNFSTAV